MKESRLSTGCDRHVRTTSRSLPHLHLHRLLRTRELRCSIQRIFAVIWNTSNVLSLYQSGERSNILAAWPYLGSRRPCARYPLQVLHSPACADWVVLCDCELGRVAVLSELIEGELKFACLQSLSNLTFEWGSMPSARPYVYADGKVHQRKAHALLPFLQSQSQNTLTKLYSKPSSCLSIFRWTATQLAVARPL